MPCPEACASLLLRHGQIYTRGDDDSIQGPQLPLEEDPAFIPEVSRGASEPELRHPFTLTGPGLRGSFHFIALPL